MEYKYPSSPKHLTRYTIRHYNGMGAAVMKVLLPNSSYDEFSIEQFAQPEFEKLVPMMPCVFQYIEEHNKHWACCLIDEKETMLCKKAPPQQISNLVESIKQFAITRRATGE